MSKLSLTRRSFIAALLVVLIFIPLTALTLEKAFVNSLTQSMYAQLNIQNLGLISEFELENGEIQMPLQLFNEQFNVPGSGTYAFIAMHLIPAWQSSSAVEWHTPPALARPNVGQELRSTLIIDQKEYFQFSYTAQFEDNGMLFPVTFHVLQDKQIFNQEVNQFRHTLWYWLGLIALLLVVLILFSLSAALRPISSLIKQIQQIEKGQAERIESDYPAELEKLKASINHLIDVEQKQRERYQHSLSDLAHSLKTPLAVLNNMDMLPADAKIPLGQIRNQIERQLKRAVGGKGSGWKKAIALDPVVEQLIGAMQKVYRDKALNIELVSPHKPTFAGNKTDIMELLGNILDNACKAARQNVLVRLQVAPRLLQISVEDDGPGIPAEQREAMMGRGSRLDTYGEGQGIGMAIVADLLFAYEGQIDIGCSELGGAKITLQFQR
ncbi:ATP-binding protein [Neptunicella sp. SCSIO 80796]|uniref:ATP-binding protein n=1 Tax=Neptunicella plasticusilytica TaxID=3117012 RepID=UPI003A4DE5C3